MKHLWPLTVYDAKTILSIELAPTHKLFWRVNCCPFILASAEVRHSSVRSYEFSLSWLVGWLVGWVVWA